MKQEMFSLPIKEVSMPSNPKEGTAKLPGDMVNQTALINMVKGIATGTTK